MINKAFQNNITTLYGAAGTKWLKELPDFLKKCEQTINIKLHNPFKQLTYNYVAPATLVNGEVAVFKCGVPNNEVTTEIEALKHFAGHGAVKLIDSNAEEGWLLLEKIIPGQMLLSIKDDDEATKIAAEVMQKLWRPIINKTKIFPTIEKWIFGFGKNPFPKYLVDRMHGLSKELLQSQGEQVLLHGDFQHYNILSATREPWLAIDPKGVIGEREFEVGALMKNPIDFLNKTTNLKKLFMKRFDIIVEITNLDRQKMIGWSFVMAMLSAWWDFDGHGKYNKLMIRCAENLRRLT